jgi:hypothetical protein
MTDRLALAKAFEDAGIERGKAETVAGVVFDAIKEASATKADVQASESRLRTELHDAVHQLTMRGLGALATGLGALFTALHYWPPH